MGKPEDFPPDSPAAKAARTAPPAQPATDDPTTEDGEPALEWSIVELGTDTASDSEPDVPGASRPTSATEQVAPLFAWREPGADPDDPLSTPPEVEILSGLEDTPPPLPIEERPTPPVPAPALLDSMLTPPPTPAYRADGPGATPAESTDGQTPRDTSDEELLILETPPVPPLATPPPEPISPPPAPTPPSPRATPAPPPVPPAATATTILLPDIPVELIGAAPGAWPEALSQRPRKKRLRPWFEEVFDEDYLRTLPFMTAEQTLREVAFIKNALAPPPDGHILDVACGYGRHAIELSQRGLRVTGLDLSLPLLIRAADESQRRSLSVNFVHADMREMSFDGQFDGAYCVLSSFGYFDEETNLKVATAICKALRPGGRFLLDTLNRDYIVSDLPTRVWWEGDGCVVLEEVDFNFHTSRVIIRRSVVFQDGRQVEQDISIRAYSLHELGKLLRQAGFRVLDVSGSLATEGDFFGAHSRNIIMVCERPNG